MNKTFKCKAVKALIDSINKSGEKELYDCSVEINSRLVIFRDQKNNVIFVLPKVMIKSMIFSYE